MQGRSLAQIRRGAVPHEQVPIPGVNSGVNVVDPGPSVPIQSKCVYKVSLHRNEIIHLSHFLEN